MSRRTPGEWAVLALYWLLLAALALVVLGSFVGAVVAFLTAP